MLPMANTKNGASFLLRGPNGCASACPVSSDSKPLSHLGGGWTHGVVSSILVWKNLSTCWVPFWLSWLPPLLACWCTHTLPLSKSCCIYIMPTSGMDRMWFIVILVSSCSYSSTWRWIISSVWWPTISRENPMIKSCEKWPALLDLFFQKHPPKWNIFDKIMRIAWYCACNVDDNGPLTPPIELPPQQPQIIMSWTTVIRGNGNMRQPTTR